MHTETDRLRSLIRAALDGLAAGPVSAPPTPELVYEFMVHIGDATRRNVRLPSTLIEWLELRTFEEINAALEGAAADITTWALPATADDETLPSLLGHRDSIANVEAAAIRWALGHDLSPAELTGLQQLQEAASTFDARLRELVMPGDAESLLGPRAGSLDASPWTSAWARRDSTPT